MDPVLVLAPTHARTYQFVHAHFRRPSSLPSPSVKSSRERARKKRSRERHSLMRTARGQRTRPEPRTKSKSERDREGRTVSGRRGEALPRQSGVHADAARASEGGHPAHWHTHRSRAHAHERAGKTSLTTSWRSFFLSFSRCLLPSQALPLLSIKTSFSLAALFFFFFISPLRLSVRFLFSLRARTYTRCDSLACARFSLLPLACIPVKLGFEIGYFPVYSVVWRGYFYPALHSYYLPSSPETSTSSRSF